MEAFLWDGNKTIKGQLMWSEVDLWFELEDFSGTALSFKLSFTSIVDIAIKNIYVQKLSVLTIYSDQNCESTFAVENCRKVVKELKSKCVNIEHPKFKSGGA
jgi:hypothetical protein